MKIAAIYARTSKDKDDAFSVESQVKAGIEYAARMGMEPKHIFREDFTGTKAERPELNKLRKLIQEQKVQALIIYKPDRLARKQYIAGYLLEEVIFPAGVELHIAHSGAQIRPGTRDILVFNIESAVAQDERDAIIERTNRGRKEKLEQGIWVGQGDIDKYGYRKVGKKRETRLEIVPEEAKVVKMIFALLVNGVRVFEIVKLLNANGTPTPSHSKGFTRMLQREWRDYSIYSILNEECYTGTFYANQWYSTTSTTGKRTSKRRPKEDWIRLDFPHLRIIEDAVFKQAQEILSKGRQRNAPNPTNEYLLARRLTCACGFAFGARTSIRDSGLQHSYYLCGSRRHRNKKDCTYPIFRADMVDDKVWQALERFIRHPEEQLTALKKAQANIELEHADALERMREAQERQAQCERELERYAELYAEGLMTLELFRKKRGELDTRFQAAEDVRKEYEDALKSQLLSDGEIKTITKDMRQLQQDLERLGELSFNQRRKLIEAMGITGKMAIENGRYVLKLFVYKTRIDTITLRENDVSQEMVATASHHLLRHTPITLTIFL